MILLWQEWIFTDFLSAVGGDAPCTCIGSTPCRCVVVVKENVVAHSVVVGKKLRAPFVPSCLCGSPSLPNTKPPENIPQQILRRNLPGDLAQVVQRPADVERHEVARYARVEAAQHVG